MYATYIADIARSTYEMTLSPQEIAQLNWILENPITTPESRTAQNTRGEFEVSRTLNRLYCLQKLWEGDYDAFIANQAEAIHLSKESFAQLHHLFKQTLKDEKGLQAMRAATIISIVTLSPEAKARASSAYPTFSQDSVEFSADTIEHCPSIYPILEGFDASQMTIIKACFPHHTHFRHMLYTEGNDGMFVTLRTKAQAAKFKTGAAISIELAQELNIWYAYWIVNLMGFNVNKDHPKGSAVINQAMFLDMEGLYSALSELVCKPESSVLEKFLELRAESLKIKDCEDYHLVAYLANWLGLQPADSAKIADLKEAWRTLDASLKIKLTEILHAKTLTPTYGPAIFRNLMSISNNVKHSVELGLKLYSEAFAQYQSTAMTQALSFLELAKVNKGGEPTALMKLSAHPASRFTIVIDPRTFIAMLSVEPVAEATAIAATSFRDAATIVPAGAGVGVDPEKR